MNELTDKQVDIRISINHPKLCLWVYDSTIKKQGQFNFVNGNCVKQSSELYFKRL